MIKLLYIACNVLRTLLSIVYCYFLVGIGVLRTLSASHPLTCIPIMAKCLIFQITECSNAVVLQDKDCIALIRTPLCWNDC